MPLPFFLRDEISGLGWDPKLTGAFLAIFIIVYGQVQSWSPHLLLSPLNQAPANKYVALLWAAALLVVPGLLGPIILASIAFEERDTSAMTGILVVRPASSPRTAVPSPCRACRFPHKPYKTALQRPLDGAPRRRLQVHSRLGGGATQAPPQERVLCALWCARGKPWQTTAQGASGRAGALHMRAQAVASHGPRRTASPSSGACCWAPLRGLVATPCCRASSCRERSEP